MDTAIANHALSLIGSGAQTDRRLSNVDTSTGQTADWFRDNWVTARRLLIGRHDWPECLDYKLAEDDAGDVAGVNHEPYLYAYRVPTTFGDGSAAEAVLACRGIVDVNDFDTILTARRGPINGYIHCDYESTDFAWKLLLDRETRFSTQLRECFAWELAMMGATFFIPGQAGTQKAEWLFARYFAPIMQGGILAHAIGSAQADQPDEINDNLPTPVSEIV